MEAQSHDQAKISRFRSIETAVKKALVLWEADKAAVVAHSDPLIGKLVNITYDLMEQLGCPDGAWSLKKGKDGSAISEAKGAGSRYSYLVTIQLTVLGQSIEMLFGFKMTSDVEHKFVLCGEELGIDHNTPNLTDEALKSAVDIVVRHAVRELSNKK